MKSLKAKRPANPQQGAPNQLSLFDVLRQVAPELVPAVREINQLIPPLTSRFTLNHEPAPTGEIGRIRANLAAISLCKSLNAKQEQPTAEQCNELAGFSGWGSLAALWDETTHKVTDIEVKTEEENRWYRKYKHLRIETDALMTPIERERAGQSALNAFFTSIEVIKRIWALLEKIGFAGGRILEPAAGTGHFIGAMPDHLRQASTITAVEKDPLSAAILALLYPEVTTHAMGLEVAPLERNTFDLVIGNVPFGDYTVFDAADRDFSQYHIHNYFIGKAARLVVPGGLVCLITSMGTLDAGSKAFRLKLDEQRMELLGAIRLPSCAFDKTASTEVTTDILLFQKRPENQARTLFAQPFVNTATLRTLTSEGEDEDDPQVAQSIQVNQYYVENTHMMLGEMSFASEVGKGGLYRGDRQTLYLERSSDLATRLDEVVTQLGNQLQGAANRFGQVGARLNEGRSERKNPALPGTVKIRGRMWSKQSIYRSYLTLKHLFFDLLKAEQNQSDSACDSLRQELQDHYTFFVTTYGRLSANRSLSWIEAVDGQFLSVQALEIQKIDATGKTLIVESAILRERIFGAVAKITHVDLIEDGLSLSLFNHGRIDLDYISTLTGKPIGEVRTYLLTNGLAFIDPQRSDELVDASTYLSGDIREKLTLLENRLLDEPQLQANADALQAVLPPSLPISLISFQLGSNWLPLACITDWIQTLLSIKLSLVYSPQRAEYIIANQTGYSALNQSQGTKERTALELIEAALNQRSIIITKTVKDEAGNKKEVKDIEAMTAAVQQQEVLQEQFNEWAREQYAPAIESAFNERFNSYVERQFAKPTMAHYPGASPLITLRDHQFKAVERGKQEDCMFAHWVGTGKTWEMISCAMELIRLGRASKALIAVQNSTVEDFAKAWRTLYPGAIIYQPTPADLQASNRKRFLQRIATNRFDGIVIPQSFLKLIPDDAAIEEELIREELSRIDYDDKDQSAEGRANRRSGKQRVKQINKRKAKIEAKRLEQASRKKDQMLNFSQLGIDALFLDECFPYQTPVFTSEGWMEIGHLVEQKKAVSVLSYCPKKRIFEWKPVTNWLKKPLRKRLVNVSHNQGNFVCTEDHKIWTIENGYVKAGQLTPAHTLVFTPVRMVPADAGTCKDAPILFSQMPLNVSCQSSCFERPLTSFQPKTPQKWLPTGLDTAQQTDGPNAYVRLVPATTREASAETILQPELCRFVSQQPTEDKWTIGTTVSEHAVEPYSGQSRARPFDTYESQQSNAQSSECCQDGSVAFRTNVPSQGREWKVDRAAETVVCRTGSAGRKYGMGHPNGTCTGEICVTSQSLQSGYSASPDSVGNRSGWKNPQPKKVEVSGPTEDCRIAGARVEGVTVYERASDAGFGFSDSESDYVYDITVAKNHNYFAAGILVSNCHKYKRFGFTTSRYQIKGIDTAGSQDAFQAMVKCRTILNKNGRVILATGTPISNTMAEAWTMLRYIASDRLEKLQLSTFDQFCGTFCKVVPVFELSTSGQFKTVERLAQFMNVAQLSALYRQSVDVVLADDVHEFKTGDFLPLLTEQPATETTPAGPGFTRILLRQTPGVLTELAEIRKTLRWFDGLTGKKKRENSHIPLVMYGKAKKATLDIRLLDPTAEDEPGNKVNRAVSEIHRLYYQTSDVKGTQLVFCDVFKSSASLLVDDADDEPAQFNLFDEIARKLRLLGIPAEEICLVPADKNKREPIFAKVRTGQIRVLMGSSERMGVGVNVQERLAAIHHLDAPNRPTDFEQRNGRIIRQGNLFAVWKRCVEILTYGVEKTLDATSYGRLAMKQKFINQVLKGGATVETMADVSDDDDFSSMNFEQMMATLSGSQTALLYTAKNHELTRLNQQKKAWQRGLMNAQSMIEEARRTIFHLNGLLPKLSLEAEVIKNKFITEPTDEVESEGLIKTLGLKGIQYTTKADWSEPLERYFSEVKAAARRTNGAYSSGLLTVNGLDINLKGEWTGHDRETGRAIYSISYAWGVNLSGQINYGWALGTSLRAAINRTLDAPGVAKKQLERAQSQQEAFSQNLNQPFKKQEQLTQLSLLVCELRKQLETEVIEAI